MKGQVQNAISVIFEHVKILKPVTISVNTPLQLSLIIHKGSGKFEVIESNTAVITGYIHLLSESNEEKVRRSIENKLEEINNKDVYKEFRLRGHQYSGPFRNIINTTTDVSIGEIRWVNNWAAFIDNMMQMKTLQYDTRHPILPVAIEKLTIDVKKHEPHCYFTPDSQKGFKVYASQKHNVIHSSGIHIHGLVLKVLCRKMIEEIPVLETYEFVTHRDFERINLKEAVRIATHLALENYFGIKVKTLEYLAEGEIYAPEELMSPIVAQILADLPMMQADVNLISSESAFCQTDVFKDINIIEPNKLNSKINAFILTGRNLLTDQKSSILRHLLPSLSDNAFIVTLEILSPKEIVLLSKKYGLDIVIEKIVNNFTFLLLRKKIMTLRTIIVIEVNNEEFTWLEKLKATLKAETERKDSKFSRILLISDKTFENGLLGFVNCLRKEPGGVIVRSILIQDPLAPNFLLSNPLYSEQLALDLATNILRPNGSWGSYRHRHFPLAKPQPVYHAWAKQLVSGDFSSFQWMEGAITSECNNQELVNVTYASINRRDIMLASGIVTADTICKNRCQTERVLGLEYAGSTKSGRRVMGLINNGALTNILNPDPLFTWIVPDCWTSEDAATVPSVYAICYYAFFFCGQVRRNDKILIHSGCSNIGQAAINLALSVGCQIFTTVDNEKEDAFIKRTFPQIHDNRIINSQNTTFEQRIIEQTNGEGVHVAFNSFADDRLQASIRCLTAGGKYLQIGKLDITTNNLLETSTLTNNISFYTITLDQIYNISNGNKIVLKRLILKGLDDGTIKPLNRSVFPRDKIESVFKYMADGKCIGKVLLKIQDEERAFTPIRAFPYYYCLEDCSYIILGGLGGFGLELCDWLILRGAKTLILTSRSGITNGYQRWRIRIWESYGDKITVISGKDASNLKHCEEILSIASEKAPVDAIYNLAVVLRDSLLENQTPQNFEESFRPKAWSVKNLDNLSRKLCPNLRHFICFSSYCCGRGHRGQTNYGMSNSVMERICEKIIAEGLPACVIQWGPIADVGVFVELRNDDDNLTIAGLASQTIRSCLQELDSFLCQTSPVVASMVIAEKLNSDPSDLNVLDTVLNIMGLKDLKSVGQYTSLSELGMDSMTVVNMKDTLQQQFDIFLTAQDIRGLNFLKLNEMNSEDYQQKGERNREASTAQPKLLAHLFGTTYLTDEVCVKLPTKDERGRPEIFLIPGRDGCASIFSNLAEYIEAPATCLQLNNKNKQHNLSVDHVVNNMLPHVLKRHQNRKQFVIIGYSFGAMIAIELARKLEAENLTGKLILIDGSPKFVKALKDELVVAKNNDELETAALMGLVDIITPALKTELFIAFKNCKSWEDKLNIFLEHAPPETLGLTREQCKNLYTCMYHRLAAIDTYETTNSSCIKSPIIVLKGRAKSLKYSISEDYDLSYVTSGKVEVRTIDGDHSTILDNPKVAVVINQNSTQVSH